MKSWLPVLLIYFLFSLVDLSGILILLLIILLLHAVEEALHFVWLYMFKFLFWLLSSHGLQVIILVILPRVLGTSGANYAKNLIRFAILVQYLPRLYRFLPLLAGQSPIGFIFESAWANFVINLLTFVLSGHVVGSGWYLFGLQVGDLWVTLLTCSLNFNFFFK